MKFAAIVPRPILVPGDERSRSNPGHGYPEHTVDAIEIIEFPTINALEEWAAIEATAFTRRKVRYIQYDELEVVSSVSVKVKTKT